MPLEEAYRALYSVSLIVITILLGVMLVRAVRGPQVTDRLLSINMVGTLVIAGILILSKLLKESWLLDVALIYTMISLVSILILARVYIPAHPSTGRFRHERKKLDSRMEESPEQADTSGEDLSGQDSGQDLSGQDAAGSGSGRRRGRRRGRRGKGSERHG